MFAAMRMAHIAAPQLRWSYYFSAQGDFLTIFPFAPSADFVALGSYASMRELIAGWLGYDVFAAGTPARDPNRSPYWTQAYRDAGGAGPMVSHAAPVYAGDRFMGVVGTDILLSYLDGFLRSVDLAGRARPARERPGQVLASSNADRGTGPATMARDALPEALAQVPLADLVGGPAGFREIAGYSVLAERLAEAPFSLLYVVSGPDLTGLILPRFKPYALILAGLMLALLAAHFLLQRRFVHPALRLVRHIQDESDGRPGDTAKVPALWRPWFATVSDAFAAGRDYQAASRPARPGSRRRPRASPTASRSSTPRIGWPSSTATIPITSPKTCGRLWRWASAGRSGAAKRVALGPVYHPEMGDNYLEHRIADRGLSNVDREHRLIDGRWVRVRESRMPDGGRVLLTTDTTDERRNRQERALVATAMAQVGDSIEITDTSYRLLYVNPAFSELTGYTAEEVLGRTPGEMLAQRRARARILCRDRPRDPCGRVWKGRIVSRHKSGSLIHQDATISPVFGESGELTYFVAAKRDVSDRIRAEAALQAQRGALPGRSRQHSRRPGHPRRRGPDRLLQQPPPRAAAAGVARGTGARHPLRGLDPRGPGARPGLPSRHGPDYARAAAGLARRALTEREHKHVDGRWVRIREAPDARRRAGAADHRHHRPRARPRRASWPPPRASRTASRSSMPRIASSSSTAATRRTSPTTCARCCGSGSASRTGSGRGWRWGRSTTPTWARTSSAGRLASAPRTSTSTSTS